MTASGTTPTERHNSASDTITAHNTGCTTSTRPSPGAPATPRMTSIKDHCTYSPSALSHRCMWSANTFEVSSNWAPIPTHCEPWPGNTNTVLPAVRARPTTTFTPGSPTANPANPSNNRSRSAPTTTARCSNTERVDTNDHPTSATPRPGSAPTCANNRSA